MARLYKGDKVEHRNGVTETPYWDSEEVAEVEFRGKRAGLTGPVRVAAGEATTWACLRWPSHFLRDGSCTCPEERP